jgi:hypothetical protein
MPRLPVLVFASASLAAATCHASPMGEACLGKAQPIVDQFIAGNFQAINQQMDVAMRMVFPAETLKASWDTMNEEFGAYVSHDAPAVFQDDGKDAFIRVPLHFAHHDTRMQIVCSSNSDGQIASLAFL